MNAWGWVVFAVVALWLAPASLWRPSALALLIQWSVGEAVYQLTGDFIPLPVYVVGDCAVIAAVYLWRSHWSDWLILAVYPVVFWLYTIPETRGQWVALYLLTLVQFVLAGPWPNMARSLPWFSHGMAKNKQEAMQGRV